MTSNLEVTRDDLERAAKASGFGSWDDVRYWSNLASQSDVADLAKNFAACRTQAEANSNAVIAELVEALGKARFALLVAEGAMEAKSKRGHPALNIARDEAAKIDALIATHGGAK